MYSMLKSNKFLLFRMQISILLLFRALKIKLEISQIRMLIISLKKVNFSTKRRPKFKLKVHIYIKKKNKKLIIKVGMRTIIQKQKETTSNKTIFN